MKNQHGIRVVQLKSSDQHTEKAAACERALLLEDFSGCDAQKYSVSGAICAPLRRKDL
jgi:hypothetical protein